MFSIEISTIKKKMEEIEIELEIEIEQSSLQEGKHPEMEGNGMLLGGWIRKRREVQQLDERETHKKPRTSAPSDQHDQESCPGGPCHHVGGGAPLQQRNTRARVTPDKGGEGNCLYRSR